MFPFLSSLRKLDTDRCDRYDLKQMLMKSPISRVPEDLRKHEAAQSKPTRGLARRGGGGGGGGEENSLLGGKGGW